MTWLKNSIFPISNMIAGNKNLPEADWHDKLWPEILNGSKIAQECVPLCENVPPAGDRRQKL